MSMGHMSADREYTNPLVELWDRAPTLAVKQILVTYFPDGEVVICAFGDPMIDGGGDEHLHTGRARTAEVAARRVLVSLTRKRRLKRIEEYDDVL